MLDQLVQYDKELFLFLNNLGSTSWDAFWVFYTDKVHWVPFYVILLFLMYKKLNTKMFVLTLVVIALMILFTDQVTNLFKKVLVKRLRPCHEDELVQAMRLLKSWCGGQYGYFSGHASNSMAVAIFSGLMLRYKYKYLIYFLIIWALAMAYSRIYIGVHYPLDVVSGMIFGALSGYLFYKLDKYLQSRFQLK
ncbi:phosphatase PAP2 family protein [Olleya sp. YSTF-M6]|uniref:Phosphatase PAP2 family protein n=1 Tax=Olleya sediminilitoris TaxID=2795739 RepID=A0ABS1WPN7_9FLAO|nr:phosphatase PAP2 family protein [Olleya sediminilitoris]MBL7561058.1 phosphatase PAP2 family protein [Olleya sediminilitoris]